MDKKSIQKEVTRETERTLGSIAGAALYAAGINLFVVPSDLYSGGVMGISQVIRTILVDFLNLPLRSFDIAGIIYYLINIPIFILAFTRIGKKFFGRTLVTVTAMTIFLAALPIKPIVADKMAACMVGGIIAGIGTGITLRMGSSGGGADIIGVMLIRWKQDFSVGRINLFINLVLYGTCLFLFDVETVIYSVIYAAVYSVAVDKVHVQNINMEVNIITKIDTVELEKAIFNELNRGITKWAAQGAYTNDKSHVLYVMISKYEYHHLRSIVRRYDPYAFIVTNEGVHIDGHYLKKL